MDHNEDQVKDTGRGTTPSDPDLEATGKKTAKEVIYEYWDNLMKETGCLDYFLKPNKKVDGLKRG